MAVASGTKIASGSIQFVRGIANSATIQNDGDQAIGSGGTALNTTLTSGGRQDIAAMILGAGTAISTTMSGGGIQEVHAGGIASDTIVRGGYQQVDAGGSAFDSIITSKGLTFIEAGASGVDAIVGSGGTMKVAGEARDPIISGGLLDLVAPTEYLDSPAKSTVLRIAVRGPVITTLNPFSFFCWNFEARRPVLFQQIPSHWRMTAPAERWCFCLRRRRSRADKRWPLAAPPAAARHSPVGLWPVSRLPARRSTVSTSSAAAPTSSRTTVRPSTRQSTAAHSTFRAAALQIPPR
jgi:autotransporter passenger strand-loop-strand repeat protein